MDRRARLSFAVIALSFVLAWPSDADAQATLINGLGGTAGYGTQCLGLNDDGSSNAIDLAPIFPAGVQFFDRTHTQMFVNTNGNVTFGGQTSTYTASAFPVAGIQPMIAPFWADVDIRGTACVQPDGGSGYAGACTNPGSNGVWWHLDPVTQQVIVTWDRVGYYDCHVDRVMSFQLVLTPAPTSSCGSGGGDFDVEFRFNRCEWNTGDASGGMNGLQRTAMCVRPLPFLPAQCPFDPTDPCTGGMCTGVAGQSGFDAGNSMDFVEIMGSRTNTIHTTLCTMSNVGETGIWRFQIRSGVVVCPGAGDECPTGMPGVCATGRTQCVGAGTECRQEVMPSEERCDALDNDCDGSVDEGDALCGALEACDLGTCVVTCFEGGCGAGQVCTARGLCVDAGCESTECPAGQRCAAGACVGACDGVTCPAGLDCRGGRCVDLCEGAVCDDCTVCSDGACEARCQFTPCPSGETCLDDGRCVETSCATVMCPAGETCVGGACIDACTGATCPSGQMCSMGMCIAAERPDAGVLPGVDGGGMSGTDGGGVLPTMDSGTPSGVDAGPLDRDRPRSSGCGCRVGGASPSGALALFGLALALVAARRRRSR